MIIDDGSTDNTRELAESWVNDSQDFVIEYYYKENGVNAGVGVYRMDLDGTNKTELTKLDSTSEVLCEFDNWLYFSDIDENEGRFEIVSKDGKQLITLYSLDLSVYDETDENTQDTNLISNDVQNSNEVSTNIVTNN